LADTYAKVHYGGGEVEESGFKHTDQLCW